MEFQTAQSSTCTCRHGARARILLIVGQSFSFSAPFSSIVLDTSLPSFIHTHTHLHTVPWAFFSFFPPSYSSDIFPLPPSRGPWTLQSSSPPPSNTHNKASNSFFFFRLCMCLWTTHHHKHFPPPLWGTCGLSSHHSLVGPSPSPAFGGPLSASSPHPPFDRIPLSLMASH